MRLLPNGNYEIENIQTGEKREVKPDELPKYGLSTPKIETPQVTVSTPQPATTTTPEIKQPSFLESVGNVALDIGKGMVAPVKRLGEGVGNGLAQAATQDKLNKSTNELLYQTEQLKTRAMMLRRAGKEADAKKLEAMADKNLEASRSASQDLIDRTKKNVADVEKGGAGTAALFLPGGNAPASRIAMSTLQGGIQGYSASENGKELPAIAGGAVVGGVMGAAGEGVRAIANKFKTGSKKLGDRLIATQYDDATRAQKTHNKLITTVSDLADYGLTSRDQVDRAAGELTGRDGAISRLTREAVSQARPVEVGQVMRDGEMAPTLQAVAEDIISDPSVSATQDKKMSNYFKKVIQGIFYKDDHNPALIGKADPERVFDAVQDLEGRAADLVKSKNYGVGVSSESQSLATAYRQFADELKRRLYQDSGADQMEAILTPDNPIIKEIADKYPKVAEKLLSAKSLAEVRSIAAPFVRGDKLVTAVEQGQVGATTAFNQGRGLGRIVPNILGAGEPVKQALSTDAVNRAAGTALRSASTANLTLPPIVGNAAIADVTSAVNGSGEQTVNNKVNQTEKNGQDTNSQKNTNSQLNPSNDHLPPIVSQSTLTGHTPEEHYQAYMMARANGDTQAAKQILQDYNAETAYQKSRGTTKAPTATQAKLQWQAQTGIRGIEEMQKMLDADPNILAKSFLTPGKLASRQYEAAALRAAESILRIQTGAQARQDEIKRYAEAYLPWFGDDAATIQYKLSQLQQDYQGLLNISNSQDDTSSTDPNQLLPEIQ